MSTKWTNCHLVKDEIWLFGCLGRPPPPPPPLMGEFNYCFTRITTTGKCCWVEKMFFFCLQLPSSLPITVIIYYVISSTEGSECREADGSRHTGRCDMAKKDDYYVMWKRSFGAVLSHSIALVAVMRPFYVPAYVSARTVVIIISTVCSSFN